MAARWVDESADKTETYLAVMKVSPKAVELGVGLAASLAAMWVDETAASKAVLTDFLLAVCSAVCSAVCLAVETAALMAATWADVTAARTETFSAVMMVSPRVVC